MSRHFRDVVSNSLKAAKRDYYISLILENKKTKINVEILKRAPAMKI